ncbi:MAG: hypothetical protein JNJ95_02285 [Dechloromonas sp.]|nr:hypothetical protein [Dechloromonas sp.]
MDTTGVVFSVLITSGLLVYLFSKDRRYKETYRPSALEAFNALSLASDNPLFQFEGKAAQIVEEKEVIEQMKGVYLAYTLTRIARNSSGEYFWFYFRADSAPVLKHIEQSRAKVLLKRKYLAP